MNRALLFSLAALGVINTITAFSAGAPEGECASMTPRHSDPQQEGKSPFNIILKKKTIAPGGSTVVVITSTPGVSIKGFLIQARVGDTPVGQFMASPKNYKTMNCLGGTKNSVTHIDAKSKSRVSVTWIAPENLAEDVIFYATIAKDYSTYWVKQKSEPLLVA